MGQRRRSDIVGRMASPHHKDVSMVIETPNIKSIRADADRYLFVTWKNGEGKAP